MICVSLKEQTPELCLQALQGLSFAEIRLDQMDVTRKDVLKIFSSHPKLIAACRPGRYAEAERKNFLVDAVHAGAAYVDMDVGTNEDFLSEVMGEAARHDCKVILSFHDFNGTPGLSVLKQITDQCFSKGTDIAKIACLVRTKKDNAKMLSLPRDPRPVVAIGMGKLGRITRIASLFCGSPFTYASLTKGKETADGQLDKDTVENILRMISHE